MSAKIKLYEQNQHFQTQINELNVELEDSHNRNAKIIDKLDLKEKELLQVKQETEGLKANMNEMSNNFSKQIEFQNGQIAGFQLNNQQKDEENQKLVEELKQLTIIINQKDNDINDLQRLQHEQQNKIQEANQSTFVIEQQRQNIERLNKNNDNLEFEILQLKKTIEQKKQEIHELNCEKMRTSKTIAELRDQVNQLQNQQLPTAFPFNVNVNGDQIEINQPKDIEKYIEHIQVEYESKIEALQIMIEKTKPTEIVIIDPIDKRKKQLYFNEIQEYVDDLKRELTHPFKIQVYDGFQGKDTILTNQEECKEHIEKLNNEIFNCQIYIQKQNTKKDKEEREENQRNADTLNEAIQEYVRKTEEYKNKFLEQEHKFKKLKEKWGEKIVVIDPFDKDTQYPLESVSDIKNFNEYLIKEFDYIQKQWSFTHPSSHKVLNDPEQIQSVLNNLYKNFLMAKKQYSSFLHSQLKL